MTSPHASTVGVFAPTGRRRRLLTLTGLVTLGLMLYAPRLDEVPLHLHYDEVLFGLQAHALATTARDVDGHLLPLYMQAYTGANYWMQPFVPYVTAVVLKVLPLSDAVIRIPTVLIGLLNGVLIYCVALRLFRREGLAVLASLLLILTPAHLIHSRLAADYVYPLPFVLGWFLCLLIYFDERRHRWLFAGCSLLGVGFYSYIASVVMMPVYLAMTLAALLSARASSRAIVSAIGGFCWPLLLLPLFLLSHPRFIGDFVTRYGLRAADAGGSALGRIAAVVNGSTIAERANLYYDFFSPGFLFLSGGSNIANSTRQAGVFLVPFAVFLLAGAYDAITRPRRDQTLVLVGFLTAPLAALIVVENYAIDRALALLPFGVLLATFGIVRMWSAPVRVSLRLAALAMAVMLAVPGLAYAIRSLIGRGELNGAAIFS